MGNYFFFFALLCCSLSPPLFLSLPLVCFPEVFLLSNIKNMQKGSTHLVATQGILTLAILLLHSVVYILAIMGFTAIFVIQDFLSTSNASYATVLSSVLVLSWRHEYRRLYKRYGKKMIENKKRGKDDDKEEKEKEKQEVDASCGRRPVRLLTYNIFCRPPFVKNNEDDYKNERLELFLQEIENYDIIALQEIFELFNTRPKYLLKKARKLGFVYTLRGTWPSFGRKFIDPGVLILSRYPIVKYDHHIFENGTEVDMFAAKQMMYAGVVVEGKMVHVFTTRLEFFFFFLFFFFFFFLFISCYLLLPSSYLYHNTTDTQATYGNNEGGAPKAGNPFYEWGQTVIKGGVRDCKEVMKECDDARVGQLKEARAFIDKVCLYIISIISLYYILLYIFYIISLNYILLYTLYFESDVYYLVYYCSQC